MPITYDQFTKIDNAIAEKESVENQLQVVLDERDSAAYMLLALARKLRPDLTKGYGDNDAVAFGEMISTEFGEDEAAEELLSCSMPCR